jgi:hypothetical protein
VFKRGALGHGGEHSGPDSVSKLGIF